MLNTTLKGVRSSFVSLDQGSLKEAFETVAQAQGLNLNYSLRTVDKSHTKAAAQVGGGALSFHTVRVKNALTSVNGDVLFPSFQVRDQTYPGSSLQIRIGFYRQVCSNGLFGFKVGALESIRHTPNNRELIARLDERIAIGLERLVQMEQQVSRLQAMEVNNPILVVESLQLPTRLGKTIISFINNSAHRPEDNPRTVWGLYNLINEIDAKTGRINSVAKVDRDHVILDKIIQAVA